jgi:hypothetical protein
MIQTYGHLIKPNKQFSSYLTKHLDFPLEFDHEVLWLSQRGGFTVILDEEVTDSIKLLFLATGIREL